MRWALVPLLLLSVPVAQAALVMEGVPWQEPIQPNAGMAPLDVQVHYACGSASEVRLEDAHLRFDPPQADRPGLLVSGGLERTIPADACRGPASAPWQASLPFHAVATNDAPGETPIAVTFRAHVDGDALVPSDAASLTVVVAVAYHGLLEAHASPLIQEALPGGELGYGLLVRNLGNALSRVELDLAQPAPPGWSVALPASFILESRQQGGTQTEATVPLFLRAPANWTGEQVFQIRLHPASTKDSFQRGEPVTVNVLARVSCAHAAPAGCQAPALPKTLPLPVAPLFLVLVLACAVVARRRA